MTDQSKILSTDISIFNNLQIRKVFYKDEWYFPINDIVYILTKSVNVVDYIKKLRSRDEELAKGWGQIVTPLWVNTAWGRQKLNCTNTKWALRIIQSIPSPRAEPFKQRLATLGNERIEEMNNPEMGIIRAKERAIELRTRQWHDDKWITKRLQGLETRNSFTDLLRDSWIKDGFEYALLTNKVYSLGLGILWWAKEYKDIKWIKKNDNLRDHMDNLEIALVDLAEAGSQKIIEEKRSKGFKEVQDAVITGSEIAWTARKNIEGEIGKSIISWKNFLTDKQKNKRQWLSQKQ